VTRAALYARVSTFEQNPESQLLDLRQLAEQRGWEITEVYIDHGVSGTRTRRPALDKLMADAARHRFDVVAVAGFDRMARSVRHLLETLDELHRLGIEFVSLRENLDSQAPLGRAIFIIVGAVAELERSLIVERVRAGMRRARLEGRHIGRRPLDLDHAAIVRDRQLGRSLGELAKTHRVSRTTIRRVLEGVTKGVSQSLHNLMKTGGRQRPPEL
jgi:DNA invertase Pin-like site-specific DNA recombinase